MSLVPLQRCIYALFLALCCLSLLLSGLARAEEAESEVEQELESLAFPFYVEERFTGDLKDIKQRKILRALVTYGRSDFYLDGGEMQGIQVELLRLYEKHLNKGIRRAVEQTKVKLIPVHFDDLIPALKEGRGDVAAAFLTATKARQQEVSFALGNATGINEILVSHKDQPEVEGWSDLEGQDVFVLSGSSYIEHLQALNFTLMFQGRKPVNIKIADDNLLSEDILELVDAGAMPRTVVDDYKAKLWSQVYPNLRLDEHVTASRGADLGWAVRKDNPELLEHLQGFVNAQVREGSLHGNMLFNRYFKRTNWTKAVTSDEERTRFKNLVPLFQKYAQQYDFDHLALAAQGFQESRLDNSKVSHRGARGIMQLLPSTAKEMGVTDLSDPEQNIKAGVRYLNWLRENYLSDGEFDPSEQMALLWAAYNAGPTKLRRMQAMTVEMGLDPQLWFGNVEIAAGRIIGRETVNYVSSIYKYYVVYTLSSRLDE